jgi:hypothetical protein
MDAPAGLLTETYPLALRLFGTEIWHEDSRGFRLLFSAGSTGTTLNGSTLS